MSCYGINLSYPWGGESSCLETGPNHSHKPSLMCSQFSVDHISVMAKIDRLARLRTVAKNQPSNWSSPLHKHSILERWSLRKPVWRNSGFCVALLIKATISCLNHSCHATLPSLCFNSQSPQHLHMLLHPDCLHILSARLDRCFALIMLMISTQILKHRDPNSGFKDLKTCCGEVVW